MNHMRSAMKKSNPSFRTVLVLLAALAAPAAVSCDPPDPAGAAAAALGFWHGPAKSHENEVYNPQPEVNDPPKIEDLNVSFTVTEGNLPGIDTDEPRTCSRTPVKVTFLVSDPDGDKVTVMVDLDGDGKFDDFKKTVKAGKPIVMKKSFDEIGKVLIKYKACDAKGLCTAELKFAVTMVLCPPRLVEFHTGSERVGIGDKIIMKLRASDAQNDKVRFEVDWDDDGVFEQVSSYFPVKKRITVTHAFQTSGLHVISAQACDELDGCSEVERRSIIVKAAGEP
jgi:hypothetical protein